MLFWVRSILSWLYQHMLRQVLCHRPPRRRKSNVSGAEVNINTACAQVKDDITRMTVPRMFNSVAHTHPATLLPLYRLTISDQNRHTGKIDQLMKPEQNI